jgi:hypothetical protein
MPTKFCGYTVTTGYTQLDPIQGMCDVTLNNPTASGVNIVTGVGSSGAALTAEGSQQFTLLPAMPYVLKIRCDPSQTWVRWTGTTPGSNRYSCIIDW